MFLGLIRGWNDQMYNRVQEVMHRSAFSEAPTNFTLISFLCHFANSSSITTVPFKPKTVRREHSSETISVVIALQRVGKSHAQIKLQSQLWLIGLHAILNRRIVKPSGQGRLLDLNEPYFHMAASRPSAPRLNPALSSLVGRYGHI